MTMKSAEQMHYETGLTPYQRDEMIRRLRRQGWSLKQIGQRVGLTESGVCRAVARLTKNQ